MTDYISREAAMEQLYQSINADKDGVCSRCPNDPHNCQYNREWTLMDFCEKIEYLGYVPAADVRPAVRGEWMDYARRGIYGMLYACSECGAKYTGKSPFCPNCGADMRAEEGET